MGTVSKTLNIVANTTYNLAIDLWAWSIWATEAGITTTYSSLANLLADEKAVRQLMTVHKSVDYLANYPSGADRETLNTIINNDICAKWINISDYAYDKLSANANIKSVMDTADKYGYGEWGKIDSNTWGALGNVPIMTANNAPYGTAIASSEQNDGKAYMPFNGSSNAWLVSTSSSATNIWVGYTFPAPVSIKEFEWCSNDGSSEISSMSYQVEGSNDGTNWTAISDTFTDIARTATGNIKHKTNDDAYYTHIRFFINSQTLSGAWRCGKISHLQFYGRTLSPLVPTMTSNTTPKGVASTNSTYTAAYNAFGSAQNFAFDGSNQYLRYQGTDKTVLKYVATKDRVNSGRSFTATYVIQGSNDGTTWDDIKTNITHVFPTTSAWWGIECGDNDDQHLYHQLVLASYTGDVGQQMTHAVQFYGSDYSEKEFAQGSTRKTIYDHGVAPSGAITGGTKNPDCLTLSAVGTATITIDKGTRTYMGGKAGLHASGTNRLKCGSGYSAFTASNMPDSNGFDISSISGSNAIGVEQTASGTFDVREIWIE